MTQSVSSSWCVNVGVMTQTPSLTPMMPQQASFHTLLQLNRNPHVYNTHTVLPPSHIYPPPTLYTNTHPRRLSSGTLVSPWQQPVTTELLRIHEPIARLPLSVPGQWGGAPPAARFPRAAFFIVLDESVVELLIMPRSVCCLRAFHYRHSCKVDSLTDGLHVPPSIFTCLRLQETPNRFNYSTNKVLHLQSVCWAGMDTLQMTVKLQKKTASSQIWQTIINHAKRQSHYVTFSALLTCI